jgi:hypothetical protein
MSRLQQLIEKGQELKGEPYDSPLVDMWDNDVKAEVAQYGEATLQVLSRAMWFGQVIRSDVHGNQMHREKIDKVCKLLSELTERNADDTRLQSQIIIQKKEEAKASLGAKFRGQMTFNGPVTFGDNSPANNVQVGELMLAIISEAEERLANGPEKDTILKGLKSVAANPTFAALAGASLPEILKRLMDQ